MHSVDVGKALEYSISDDHSFIPAKTYEFQVKSFNTTGESAPSTERVCYTFPGKLNPVDLDPDQLTEHNNNDPIKNDYKNVLQSKEKKDETRINFTGFGVFIKPSGPVGESDVYVGTRPDNHSGRVHTVQPRIINRGANGFTASGESYRLWSGANSVNYGRDQHSQQGIESNVLDRGEAVHFHTDVIQNSKRSEDRVRAVQYSTEDGSSYKPDSANQPTNFVNLVWLAVGIILAVILWAIYGRNKE